MRKILLFLISFVCISLRIFAQDNPVFQQHPEDIIFHLSYDAGSLSADMAEGDGKPFRQYRAPEFTTGVFGGKALKSGSHVYWTKKNFYPNQSGTLIAWVSPLNWPSKQPDLKTKEPAFTVFSSGLILGKMFRQNWSKSCMHFTVQYSKNSCGVHISSEGNVTQWKNGQWHLLVATWDLGNIALSIDGSPSKSIQIPKKAIDHNVMTIGTNADQPYHVAIDEITILKRKLSTQEITALYQQAKPLIRQNTSAAKK